MAGWTFGFRCTSARRSLLEQGPPKRLKTEKHRRKERVSSAAGSGTSCFSWGSFRSGFLPGLQSSVRTGLGGVESPPQPLQKSRIPCCSTKDRALEGAFKAASNPSATASEPHVKPNSDHNTTPSTHLNPYLNPKKPPKPLTPKAA